MRAASHQGHVRVDAPAPVTLTATSGTVIIRTQRCAFLRDRGAVSMALNPSSIGARDVADTLVPPADDNRAGRILALERHNRAMRQLIDVVQKLSLARDLQSI